MTEQVGTLTRQGWSPPNAPPAKNYGTLCDQFGPYITTRSKHLIVIVRAAWDRVRLHKACM